MKLPIINSQDRVSGEWQFTILDGKTRKVVREYEPFKNLVLDLGLDRMGSGSVLFSYCRIGTGTAAAATTDTGLQTQSASTNTQITTSAANAGAPNYETVTTMVWEFVLGAVVGNMAEIGAGWTASTASTLFSRARINDAGGSPTTITVLVTEILQATYRLTVYPKLTDDTGTVTIGGVSYDYISRRYSIDSSLLQLPGGTTYISSMSVPTAYATVLSANTGTGPSGLGSSGMQYDGFDAYTNGTYYRDANISASISQGNATGGIQSIGWNYTNGAAFNCYRQMQFNATSGGAVIPKDSTKTFSIKIRHSWARYP